MPKKSLNIFRPVGRGVARWIAGVSFLPSIFLGLQFRDRFVGSDGPFGPNSPHSIVALGLCLGVFFVCALFLSIGYNLFVGMKIRGGSKK
jgi:hypothetical protein